MALLLSPKNHAISLIFGLFVPALVAMLAFRNSDHVSSFHSNNENGMPGFFLFDRQLTFKDFSNQGNGGGATSTQPPSGGCSIVSLILASDDFPQEITWELKDSQGIIANSLSVTTELQASTQTTVNLGCLDSTECYTFTILDSSGDGICCLWGTGSYRIQLDGVTQVERNGQYGFGESVTFGNSAACQPLPTPPPNDGGFNITLVDMTPGGGADPKYAAAFEEAKARWEEIITGDLPDIPASSSDWFDGFFFEQQPYTQPIDDLLIGFSTGGFLDGVGGTLGQVECVAGFGFRCHAGTMEFEGADLDTYDTEDVKSIILHEMGHVLGAVGALGNCGVDSCYAGQSNSYTCPNAVREYNELSTGMALRLENDGGHGTKCAHWENDGFVGPSSELMTGFFEADRYQPISRVTLGSLDDLGVYTINYGAADDWPFDPSSSGRTGRKVFQTKGNFYLPSLMQESMAMKKASRRRTMRA